MKLAITTEGNNVSKHFGKCENFTIVEIIEGQVVQQYLLDTSQHLHGELVPYLKENKVDVILAGSMGSGALDKVQDLKLLAFSDIEGSIDEVIKDYISGKLTSDKPAKCSSCQCNCHDN